MKAVIVTGIGQDGYFLSKQLLEKGFKVIGVDQWQTKGYNPQLKELMSNEEFKLIEGDITDRYLIRRLLQEYKPVYFFNTAAISHVKVSFDIPTRVTDVNYLAVIQILEEIRTVSPETRFLQCSTSEQFGDNLDWPQDENSKMLPNSPYAMSKLGAYFIAKLFRRYGLKIYNSIAFNHESEIRPENFVTRKITKGLSDIKKGLSDKLCLGNIDTFRDWGYAPDYTKAMIKIIESDAPDDYVLSTGERHSVREFIEEACKCLNMNLEWKGKGLDEIGYIDGKPRIFISKEFYRPADVYNLCGNASKIKEKLGWEPKVKFKDLVKIMVGSDLNN
jgi:GDPmannose 4,6-dehydratase